MNDMTFATPLLSPDSPLDQHSKELIAEIYAREQAKALGLPTDDPLDPKRRARVDLTLTEMWEQPEIIQKNLELEKQAIEETAAYIASLPLERIYMTGCGDSIASMIAVRGFYEEILGIPCETIQALDFTYYYNRPVNERSLVITLSSSGTTVRTVEAMLVARAKGAVTLTLSNTQGSPLMVESSRGLLIRAQRKGWPTQSSTAAMALLYQLGIDLARKKGYPANKLDEYQKTLNNIPKLVEQVLNTQDKPVEEIANEEAERKIYLFAGGGPAYASTLIGAAKVRELSPDHSIAIPLEEFHHSISQ